MCAGGLSLYTEENKQQGYRYYLPLYANEETAKEIKQGNSRYIELDDRLSRRKIVLKEFAEPQQNELRCNNHQFYFNLDVDSMVDVDMAVNFLLSKEIDCTVYTYKVSDSKRRVTYLKFKANSNNYYEEEQINRPFFENPIMPVAIEFQIDNAAIYLKYSCELKIKGKLSQRAKVILNQLICRLDTER